MKKLLLLLATLPLVLTGCIESGEPNLSEMPEGALQRYRFVNIHAMTADTLLRIELWREDTLAEGGLLSYRDDAYDALSLMPMPIKVSEAVFDSVRSLIAQHQLYKMATWYKTDWKGDAYGYAPWTFEAEFPEATIRTESDGTTPKEFSFNEYGSANKFLERIYKQEGYRWLAAQPINIVDHASFSNLQQRFSKPEVDGDSEDNPTTSSAYCLCCLGEDEPVQEFTLAPDGRNQYRDQKTGQRLCLEWVEDELMLSCYKQSGEPLWTMSAHESCYEKRALERQLQHVFLGQYTLPDGQQVSITDGRIKGFPDKEERRCVLQDYHEWPAERFVVGDYPDETYYAFRRSQSGLNIYATRWETEEETDANTVPTDPVTCLRRSGKPDYAWLHREPLDSYILRYYSPAERQAMLNVCESAGKSASAWDQWNAKLLRAFMDTAPFEAEADCK